MFRQKSFSNGSRKRKSAIFRLMIALATFAAAFSPASGASYIAPKFGKPIVSESSILFTEPARASPRMISKDWKSGVHRIISVDRKTGAKKWEITDPDNNLGVCLSPEKVGGNRYVIMKGNDLFFCDPDDGKTTLAYQTGLEQCSITAHRGASVLVKGRKDDVYRLQRVDLQSGKKLWEVRDVETLLSQGGGLILCQRSEHRVDPKTKDYRVFNRRLTAIREEDGRIQWEHPQAQSVDMETGLYVENHFITLSSPTIFCYDHESGNLLKSRNLVGKGWGSVSVCQQGKEFLAWVSENSDSGGAVYAISVPDLEERRLLTADWYAALIHVAGDVLIGETIGRTDVYHLGTRKKIWVGGQRLWEGVHDGYIYYSAMDHDGIHTVLIRIHAETGERKLLYRELLPAEMQWEMADASEMPKEELPLRSDYRLEKPIKAE